MSKGIGKPLDIVPSLPPYGAVDRSTKSPTNSASVNPRFMPGSVVLRASGSTEWTGTIAPALHTQPLKLCKHYRIVIINYYHSMTDRDQVAHATVSSFN